MRIMAEDDRAPPHVDIYTPNMARMYDYALGGKDNFAYIVSKRNWHEVDA
jgi:S-adenosyl methyltransferase